MAMVQRIGRLTSLADVVDAIGRCAPVEPREVATAEAFGYILAADVVSARAIPAASVALRDGWAVNAEATRDAGPYAPLQLEPPPRRIDAFTPLPPGADAIAPPDAVSLAGGQLQITAPVAPGESVLPISGDVPKSGLLLAAGARLRASDIAVLMAAGVNQLRVRAPRLTIVNTKPGVLEPVVQFVANAAKAAGASVTVDGDENLDAALRAGSADAVIGIGGTGSGRKDRAVNALSRAGKLFCHGIGLAPGDTTAFGHIKGRPTLLLPGRVDAAIASWLVLGRALLARLADHHTADAAQPAKLCRKVTSTVGISELVTLRLSEDGATPLASGFASLQQLAQADGWMLVPAESEGYAAGTMVQVRPLP
ncbi:MAG: molybdopterin-binding protein [Pseudorhodoplanes sp.]